MLRNAWLPKWDSLAPSESRDNPQDTISSVSLSLVFTPVSQEGARRRCVCVILEGDSAFRGDLSPEPVGSRGHYLFLLDDADPGLDVGEGVHGGEDGVPPVLLVQLSPGPPLQGERGGVHEPSQIEILLKVCYPVFHLILIKVGLHESDLYVGLRGKRGKEEMSSSASHHPGCTGEACWDTAPLLHPWARPKATEAEHVRLTSGLPRTPRETKGCGREGQGCVPV